MMAHYLAHVYSAVLPIHLFAQYSRNTGAVNGYELLAELYVLGERMLDSSIREAVLKQMVQLGNSSWIYSAAWAPPTKSINTIYTGTTAGSPARRLLVDLNVSFGRTDWNTADADHEFLFDLTQAMITSIQACRGDMSLWREKDLKVENYVV